MLPAESEQLLRGLTDPFFNRPAIWAFVAPEPHSRTMHPWQRQLLEERLAAHRAADLPTMPYARSRKRPKTGNIDS